MALLVGATLAGCGGDDGPPRYEGKGKVTFQDGSPVDDATMTLRDDTTDPKAPVTLMLTTDADGNFVLRHGEKSGSPKGTYKVAIGKFPRKTGDAGPQDMMKGMQGADINVKGGQKAGAELGSGAKLDKSLLQEKYNNPETSGITITVSEDSSKNVYEIKLDK